ncbi:hypothetical protein OIDMADRAFT_118140 [Neofusicoccum parvum]|nr:hypothetical protein OIDMADRAFT_118140 [Neofusicoccum parvum]
MHRKHGKTFAHATPGKLEVFTADAAIAHQVFTKREGFRKQCDSAQILDLYGPSLVTNILLLYFVPDFIYKLPWLPKKHVEAQNCSRELKKYLTEFVHSRRVALNTDGEANNNFLTSLVKHNMESKSEALSDEELYGNLFTWTFGGHETSANTFSHAVFLLAAHPDIQDWLLEELRTVQLTYDSFTQMRRCMAVMFETLRLFPTVTMAPKSTGLSAVGVLSEDGVTHTFPAQTDVKANIPTLHVQQDHWGLDSLLWKPSRWIDSNAEETLRAPVKGSFLPWTDGPRVCPGKKFAQVSFVATVATIVSQYKIEVVPCSGEVMEQARERAWKAVQDSYAALTLEIRAPEKVKFRLLKRS